MKTLRLALRNLLRNRRRSITTLLAMMIGVTSILLFGGYSNNIKYGLQTRFVHHSGHLQVQKQGFFIYGTGNPSVYGIADYARIIDAVKRDPELARMVRVVTPTLQVSGIAGNFAVGVSRTVVGSGTVIADQNEMQSWNDYGFPLDLKPLALTGTSKDSAVVGAGVARVLQLCGPLEVADCSRPPLRKDDGARPVPADIVALSTLEKDDRPAAGDTRIELLAANVRGAPNVAGLNVVKVEIQGQKEFDDLYIGLHLEQALQLVYGNAPPRVTAVILQLAHTGQIPAAKARLERLLAAQFEDQDLEVHDFATLNPMYGQSLRMFATIFGFFALLIGAIVLFTVGNTMSMTVVERTVEIGTLRAMGLRRDGIRRLFVSEGFLLGATGAVLGVLASIGLSELVNNNRLTWTPPGFAVPVPLTIHVLGETALIAGSAVGLMIVAMLSALWPANRAARMNIVDALRHV